MRISVIGCGYLGAVHAACMADLGHDVVGIDVDRNKIELLARAEAPIFEPGLADLLERGVSSGRLRFVTAPAAADLAAADVHFIAVGTPQADGTGAADLHYVDAAVDAILQTATGAANGSAGPVVVGKSTVPVGTAERLAARLGARGFSLVWNPEFLREGFAVQDTLYPDRIVYGLATDPLHADRGRRVLDEVYAPMLAAGIPQVVTSYPTAELVKVAANSFLATKISFINAMAEVCETAGGDVTQLAEALGYDERIGSKFLRAGVGFGGGCLPKDIRAFVARAGELGVGDTVQFLRQVDAINLRRRRRVVELAHHACGKDLQGARVAVLGAAFKPESDDIRDSPALDVARRIARLGAHVTICDPRALPAVRGAAPELATERDPYRALAGADLALLLTEWREFVDLDPVRAARHTGSPTLIDGRNALDHASWRAAGWTCYGLGRPCAGPVNPPSDLFAVTSSSA